MGNRKKMSLYCGNPAVVLGWSEGRPQANSRPHKNTTHPQPWSTANQVILKTFNKRLTELASKAFYSLLRRVPCWTKRWQVARCNRCKSMQFSGRDSYLVSLGSSGPFPCNFLTRISLLLLIASRIFPNEPLRWRTPTPS